MILTEDESVGTGPSLEHVVALATDQKVVQGATEEMIVSLAAEQPVGTGVAIKKVVALFSVQVVAGIPTFDAHRLLRRRRRGPARLSQECGRQASLFIMSWLASDPPLFRTLIVGPIDPDTVDHDPVGSVHPAS